MKEKRFQVGDKVTYKDTNELPDEKYYYGGDNQKGFVGTITEYLEFQEELNCYKIEVTQEYEVFNNYSMLESEFEEYDDVQKKHHYKVGDVVTTHKFKDNYITFNNSMIQYDGKKGNISSVNEERGTVQVHGWYWPFSAIKLVSEEPNSKFNIGEVVNTTNEGYVFTNMDKHAYDTTYIWSDITDCNCKPSPTQNTVVKDKVYSSIQDKWWYKFDEFDNWVSECGVSSIIPIVDSMDAILQEAIRKYPIGTKYIPVNCSGVKYSNMSEFEVTHTPRIVHDHNYIDGGVGYLYAQGVWAEVVPETESVFKSPPTIQSVSSVTSSGTNPITLLSVTTPTIGTNPWGYTDSSALSPLSPKTTPFINPLPESIQNTMPDEDIVHRENTIKAMQL